MNAQFTQRRWFKPTLFASGAVLLVLLVWWFMQKPADTAAPSATATLVPPATDVASTGRIETAEPVTHVGASYINGHPGMIAELKVAVGDSVHTGQILAILDGQPELEAAVHQAQARVTLDQVKLDQVKAGPRATDLDAQKAEVARCQLAFDTAQAEYKRYEALQQNQDVSASDVDAKRTEMENAHHLNEEAQAHLAGLVEIRPEDVRLAESELQMSRAELDRAQLELDATQVKSPADGVVLHIHARPGEEVGPEGVLELAKTAKMCVIAEVYETDIGRVKLGQKAEITSELLPGQTLQGTVATIGREIGRADLIPTDPAAFADSRVVLVGIQLPDSQLVSGLIHGKVSVIIHP